MDALKEIIAKKKQRLDLAKQALPENELKVKIEGLPPCRPFLEAISKPNSLSLIAEVKKASISRGVIRENFDPIEICRIYADCGVQAISVLTEEDYFQGSLDILKEIRQQVSLPLLRKDFIFEPYQIYESRYFGADCVLLIAEALTKDSLFELIGLADSLGLDCLVETHQEKELKKILNLKVPAQNNATLQKSPKKSSEKKTSYVNFAIGINNRDLHTLEVDLRTTERLYPLIPRDRIVVVESGLKTRQDVLFLKVLGVEAVLIGEAFMSAEDVKAKIEELMGW